MVDEDFRLEGGKGWLVEVKCKGKRKGVITKPDKTVPMFRGLEGTNVPPITTTNSTLHTTQI